MLKMSKRLLTARNWLCRNGQKLTQRQIQVSIGVTSAVCLSLVLLAIAKSPTPRPQKLARAGQQLFEEVLGEHPSVRNESRVRPASNRGTATNRIVLPNHVWDSLTDEQRTSLAVWLNIIGGSWDIRVGDLTDDANRVTNTKAIISSRSWSRQTQ